MNWPRKHLIFSAALIVLGWVPSGCGVKGDPLPPERPAELGRGRPSYRKATEKIQLERAPVPDERQEEDEDDSE